METAPVSLPGLAVGVGLGAGVSSGVAESEKAFRLGSESAKVSFFLILISCFRAQPSAPEWYASGLFFRGRSRRRRWTFLCRRMLVVLPANGRVSAPKIFLIFWPNDSSAPPACSQRPNQSTTAGKRENTSFKKPATVESGRRELLQNGLIHAHSSRFAWGTYPSGECTRQSGSAGPHEQRSRRQECYGTAKRLECCRLHELQCHICIGSFWRQRALRGLINRRAPFVRYHGSPCPSVF